MKFLIITHVPHKKHDNLWFGYAPYVREMNLWLKYVDKVEIVAPSISEGISSIDLAYRHKNIKLNRIPSIQFTSVFNILLSLFKLPLIFYKIFKACTKADHIHLRCPGNIGLLGCLVQVFFPEKIKTVKYAGNWDPSAKQPLSYKFQKWILNNTLLSKNMQVLVYGKWKRSSKNILPFFTATYSKNEIIEANKPSYFFDNEDGAAIIDIKKKLIKFLFIGSLSEGKQPLLTAEVILELVKLGYQVQLDIYGEGKEYGALSQFISLNKLQDQIILHGNADKEIVKDAYRTSDFLLFLSKSEGWPKVIAEAMFWGCLPISSNVSCIPYMLDNGNRGAIVNAEVENIITSIEDYLFDKNKYSEQVKKGIIWSRQYTLEKFEEEISVLLKQ